jgi:hypothetical protein
MRQKCGKENAGSCLSAQSSELRKMMKSNNERPDPITREKEKIEIPEDFEPKPDCVCCNSTGVKTYLINLFDGEIYREEVCHCHCLRRVRVI